MEIQEINVKKGSIERVFLGDAPGYVKAWLEEKEEPRPQPGRGILFYKPNKG